MSGVSFPRSAWLLITYFQFGRYYEFSRISIQYHYQQVKTSNLAAGIFLMCLVDFWRQLNKFCWFFADQKGSPSKSTIEAINYTPPPSFQWKSSKTKENQHKNYPRLQPVLRILCKQDSIYVFPQMKLRGLVPNFHIHLSVSNLYRWIDRGNI